MVEKTKPIKKTNNALLLFILIISLIIIPAVVISLLNKRHKKDIKIIQDKHNQEMGISKCYIIKQQRLECMVKTLMIAYKLSKWEAYYLCTMFDDFSTKYNTPWEVFPAVIRVESNFNPSAKSPANCFGLMQLKKATGKELAHKLGIRFNNKTLWNDFVNIILGSTYLCGFIEKKGLKEGVKSYLGGPDYKKSVKNNHDTRKYVKEYKTTVISEYEKLSLMFRGVVDELGYTYKDVYLIPRKSDPTPLIFTLFTDSTDTTK